MTNECEAWGYYAGERPVCTEPASHYILEREVVQGHRVRFNLCELHHDEAVHTNASIVEHGARFKNVKLRRDQK